MASEEWTRTDHVRHYLERTDEMPRLVEGERALLEQMPGGLKRVLDLGTGDGRLIAALHSDHPEMTAIGIDVSDLMLEKAGQRFAGDDRVELIRHDLDDPLPPLDPFDAVVSSLAIHHLEHPRKRSLYAESFELLRPGGVFANFEHVASPTDRLHRAFFEAIGEPIEMEDPSDRLLDVEAQLGWLRDIGFEDVDCYWKWLEMALIIGVKPS